MADSRWERMWELFHDALEMAPDERSLFLDTECSGDAPLREDIRRLLSKHGDTSGLLERHGALPALDSDLSLDPLLGEQIGPYRIIRIIGEGGMGVVYEAEQDEPVRRRVALKVIRVGMDTSKVVARFDAERQALAMMNHRCIAQVYDAGASESGRPYFVMELVDGVPITEYCDSKQLGTAERLPLFLQVCSGLRHAHRKGIIHRDIKPSNLLVTHEDGEPSPKIIDFGIAKATQQRLTEKTAFTAFGDWVGTPEYMSPEQADLAGDDIDTRTDVYSLGVLLYELLAGALPFDPRELREAGFDELRRKIREDQPSKPSTRVGTLDEEQSSAAGRHRQTDIATLRSQLAGDLDWITMKALEKDRERRYESVSDLADDIARHMRHEPVLAGPPSIRYRAGKFVRRHSVATSLAALATLFVVTLAIVMTLQAGRLARERDQVRLEAETSRRVSEFLIGIFEVSDPGEARGNTVTAREVLDNGAKQIEESLSDQPEVRARLLHTIGEVYRSLGLYPEAQPLLEESLEIRRQELGEDHPETLSTMSRLGVVAFDRENFELAVKYHTEALEKQRRVLGEDHPDTASSLNNLGVVLMDQGKYAEAQPLLEQAVERRRRILGPGDPKTMTSAFTHAQLLGRLGESEEAVQLHLQVLNDRRAYLGENHPETLKSLNDLGFLLLGQGKLDEAEVYIQGAVDGNRDVLGKYHRETLAALSNLAALRGRQGRTDESITLHVEVLEAKRRTVGPNAPGTLISLNNVGVGYAQQGKLTQAEAYFLESLDANRRVRGEDHPETLTCLNNLGWLRRQQGKPAEAVQYYQASLDGKRRVFGDEHANTITGQLNLTTVLAQLGRDDEVDTLLSSAHATAIHILPEQHVVRARACSTFGSFLKRKNRMEDAEPVLKEAYEILSALSGADNPRSQGVARELMELYAAQNRPEDEAAWKAKAGD